MIQKILNENTKLPVKIWCRELEAGALEQAVNLANHPVVVSHVALMPDAHQGYGMPIGGVIGCKDAVIPNAVGVDIGCGMGAVKTSLRSDELPGRETLRALVEEVKRLIPVGEGNSRKNAIPWEGFVEYRESVSGVMPGWWNEKSARLDECNLGTLGGGNHFIELQTGDDRFVWLMLHSGSRNLGYRIADYYHRKAVDLNTQMNVALPDRQLAYLPLFDELGRSYVRDMNHALCYAAENRRLMMEELKEVVEMFFPGVEFEREVNIHHNYAALERFEGEELWIHRKGATSARKGELGIIPGSMGSYSYIVEGLGNPESFESCSHGAGRRMGRADACRRLTAEECDRAMGDVVYDRWKLSDVRGADKKKLPDLSEAPLAYKDIDDVIESELDLVKPLVKLTPKAVVKG